MAGSIRQRTMPWVKPNRLACGGVRAGGAFAEPADPLGGAFSLALDEGHDRLEDFVLRQRRLGGTHENPAFCF